MLKETAMSFNNIREEEGGRNPKFIQVLLLIVKTQNSSPFEWHLISRA